MPPIAISHRPLTKCWWMRSAWEKYRRKSLVPRACSRWGWACGGCLAISIFSIEPCPFLSVGEVNIRIPIANLRRIKRDGPGAREMSHHGTKKAFSKSLHLRHGAGCDTDERSQLDSSSSFDLWPWLSRAGAGGSGAGLRL